MTKRITQILCWNLFGILLLSSQYYSYRDGFWFDIDSTIFHFFNHFLDGSHKTFLYLIAVTNHRIFDVISFVAMALLYYLYFRRENKDEKQKMIALGLMMLMMAVLIKQWGRFIPIAHESPTLYFEPFESINRISKLTHFGTKDASGDSFPGDHGMMLMIFAAFMWRYFGLKAFIQSAIIVIVFSAPRIIAGAHWFTDVYVGSLAITSIVLSWFLLTPASDYLVHCLLRLIPKRFFKTS
ncbi:phosphatase PAP2 family protein [Orbus sturtevantii]|uniref:phosphatase PAP2 family protein n=1 Tax=Orbus sturtevantii TaxID=3074109 RepID=UPI00370D2A67